MTFRLVERACEVPEGVVPAEAEVETDRFLRQLAPFGPDVSAVLDRVPLQNNPPLPPNWLRCEMLERLLVLQHAGVAPDSTVLEVGSGGHAISTVPLAYLLGPKGTVLAAERRRWNQFRAVVAASGMTNRIRPISCDARWLPFRDDAVELAVCIHGLRSLQSKEIMVSVFRQMLRVAPRIFLAESLPIAKSDAQRAHIAMYNLRQEVFQASTGRRDDLHYLPLSELRALVERAGGAVKESRTLNIDLPHALAYFPRTLVEAIPAGTHRDALLRRWDDANAVRLRCGTDHPPVGTVAAGRS